MSGAGAPQPEYSPESRDIMEAYRKLDDDYLKKMVGVSLKRLDRCGEWYCQMVHMDPSDRAHVKKRLPFLFRATLELILLRTGEEQEYVERRLTATRRNISRRIRFLFFSLFPASLQPKNPYERLERDILWERERLKVFRSIVMELQEELAGSQNGTDE